MQALQVICEELAEVATRLPAKGRQIRPRNGRCGEIAWQLKAAAVQPLRLNGGVHG
jgi:hypothetical protein